MNIDYSPRDSSGDLDPDAALAELEALSAVPFVNPDAFDPFATKVELVEDPPSGEDDKSPEFPDMTSEHWIGDAACGGLPAVIFMPESVTKERVRTAKAICSECPVRIACREYAIENNEPLGVWGGLTRRERTEAKQARKYSQSTSL